MKLLLVTIVRESARTNARWREIDCSAVLWTIRKERMKRRHESGSQVSALEIQLRFVNDLASV